MNVKINVTQDHIDRANGMSHVECCPVALALIDAGFSAPRVGKVSFSVCQRDGNGTFDRISPKRLVDKIKKYDKTRQMSPFSFIIKDITE